MTIDLLGFTPVASLCGGILIGISVGMLILLNGRIAGISGILGGLLRIPDRETTWRVAFLAGLIGASVLAAGLGYPVVIDIQAGWGEILIAGFLVGIGTRYADGCTSGHGVCGVSRGAIRSLIATTTFMAMGFLTTFVMRHLLGV